MNGLRAMTVMGNINAQTLRTQGGDEQLASVTRATVCANEQRLA